MTDSDFSKMIYERDGGFCLLCSKPGSEVHHIFSRRHKSIRHDPENGILLCNECHREAHEKPKKTFEKIKFVMDRLYRHSWEMELISRRDVIFKIGEKNETQANLRN